MEARIETSDIIDAVRFNNVDLCQTLYNRNNNCINFKNVKGKDLLTIAVQFNAALVAKWLLEKKFKLKSIEDTEYYSNFISSDLSDATANFLCDLFNRLITEYDVKNTSNKESNHWVAKRLVSEIILLSIDRLFGYKAQIPTGFDKLKEHFIADEHGATLSAMLDFNQCYISMRDQFIATNGSCLADDNFFSAIQQAFQMLDTLPQPNRILLRKFFDKFLKNILSQANLNQLNDNFFRKIMQWNNHWLIAEIMCSLVAYMQAKKQDSKKIEELLENVINHIDKACQRNPRQIEEMFIATTKGVERYEFLINRVIFQLNNHTYDKNFDFTLIQIVIKYAKNIVSDIFVIIYLLLLKAFNNKQFEYTEKICLALLKCEKDLVQKDRFQLYLMLANSQSKQCTKQKKHFAEENFMKAFYIYVANNMKRPQSKEVTYYEDELAYIFKDVADHYKSYGDSEMKRHFECLYEHHQIFFDNESEDTDESAIYPLSENNIKEYLESLYESCTNVIKNEHIPTIICFSIMIDVIRHLYLHGMDQNEEYWLHEKFSAKVIIRQSVSCFFIKYPQEAKRLIYQSDALRDTVKNCQQISKLTDTITYSPATIMALLDQISVLNQEIDKLHSNSANKLSEKRPYSESIISDDEQSAKKTKLDTKLVTTLFQEATNKTSSDTAKKLSSVTGENSSFVNNVERLKENKPDVAISPRGRP